MEYRFVCCVLTLCCLRPVLADCVPLQHRSQYAYVGGYGGIFGFRVRSDGSLQSLQARPLAKGLFLDQLLADPKTETIFGTSVDNKLYSYTVGPNGHLSLKSGIPFDAASGTAVIDTQTHRLYAADGDHSLLVYDISNPSHLVRRRNIVTPITIQNIVIDQADHSLLIWGQDTHTTGRGSSALLRCFLRPQSACSSIAATHVQGVNTLTVAGPYLVAGNQNSTLTVYRVNAKAVQILSHQPLLEADAAHLPANIIYRHQGSFLYISIYYGAGSAQAAQPANAVTVRHLGTDGQLGPQANVGNPVPNPRPYLDKTGRFLYIVGEEGTVDAYKIAPSGKLAPVGSQSRITAPTGMIFVSGPVPSPSPSRVAHPATPHAE